MKRLYGGCSGCKNIDEKFYEMKKKEVWGISDIYGCNKRRCTFRNNFPKYEKEIKVFEKCKSCKKINKDCYKYYDGGDTIHGCGSFGCFHGNGFKEYELTEKEFPFDLYEAINLIFDTVFKKETKETKETKELFICPNKDNCYYNCSCENKHYLPHIHGENCNWGGTNCPSCVPYKEAEKDETEKCIIKECVHNSFNKTSFVRNNCMIHSDIDDCPLIKTRKQTIINEESNLANFIKQKEIAGETLKVLEKEIKLSKDTIDKIKRGL